MAQPYTHSILLHGPKPVLKTTKKDDVAKSNPKTVTCYTCVDEQRPIKKLDLPDYCGHRVGDRVKHYKNGLRGSVVWVSGCKTHVRVRVEGQGEVISSEGLTNASVIDGSDGSYTFNSRVAASLRADGKLIEHGGRWRPVGPDIDVEKSDIMAQRTAKELYYAKHPPQLQKVDVSVESGYEVNHILAHTGNVGDHNAPTIYRVVGAPQHAPDPEAAGARPRRDAVANGNGFGERGKRRAVGAAAAMDNGTIIAHVCSARGTAATSNMLYGSGQHAAVAKFDHPRGAAPAEVLGASHTMATHANQGSSTSSRVGVDDSATTSERRARATALAAAGSSGYLRPTRASSARRDGDRAQAQARTHATHPVAAAPAVAAGVEAARVRVLARPLSARLLQPTHASRAMAAGTDAREHGRLRPDQYGAVSARNGKVGLDKSMSGAGMRDSARGWETERYTARDTARDSARESARTMRGHPVVDNWVPR